MAEPRFRAPRGTRDIMPPESDRRRALVALFGQVVGQAGYSEIATPIFEDIGVFQRLGESTDVVTKEMYDFHDAVHSCAAKIRRRVQVLALSLVSRVGHG